MNRLSISLLVFSCVISAQSKKVIAYLSPEILEELATSAPNVKIVAAGGAKGRVMYSDFVQFLVASGATLLHVHSVLMAMALTHRTTLSSLFSLLPAFPTSYPSGLCQFLGFVEQQTLGEHQADWSRGSHSDRPWRMNLPSSGHWTCNIQAPVGQPVVASGMLVRRVHPHHEGCRHASRNRA